MRALAAIATCFLFFGCGPRFPAVTVYYRTSPRRVEVIKQVSPSSPFASAMRVGPGAIDVHLKRASRVTLHRVLHYNSTAIVYEPISALYKGLEILGGLWLVMWGEWDVGARVDGQNTSERRVVRRRGHLLAHFDPTTSAVLSNIRTESIVKEQIFSNPPVTREYEIRLPASEMVVAFRILDEAKNELARGLATTNPYGELHIQGALENAVAVELSTDGTVIIIPIQASPKPPSTAPVEPAAMPHALASTALANDGWGRRSEDDFLPRVTLTLDIARLLSSDFTLSGEVRLYRKISVGGLAGRESFRDDLSPGARETKINVIGGYMRTYAIDVDRGPYFEGKYLRGFNDITSGTDTLGVEFGLGLKYTFYGGVTVDLGGGWRYLSDFKILGHINLGWSF